MNGYGVIGKRVAGAVACQDDMELVGGADGRISTRVARQRAEIGAGAPRAATAFLCPRASEFFSDEWS